MFYSTCISFLSIFLSLFSAASLDLRALNLTLLSANESVQVASQTSELNLNSQLFCSQSPLKIPGGSSLDGISAEVDAFSMVKLHSFCMSDYDDIFSTLVPQIEVCIAQITRPNLRDAVIMKTLFSNKVPMDKRQECVDLWSTNSKNTSFIFILFESQSVK